MRIFCLIYDVKYHLSYSSRFSHSMQKLKPSILFFCIASLHCVKLLEAYSFNCICDWFLGQMQIIISYCIICWYLSGNNSLEVCNLKVMICISSPWFNYCFLIQLILFTKAKYSIWPEKALTKENFLFWFQEIYSHPKSEKIYILKSWRSLIKNSY